MASKVIRNVKTNNFFQMREFATVERGQKDYDLRSFADDEELSVQDMFSDTGEDEPDTIEEVQDEVTEKDYWPPSRLAKAEEGLIGEVVDMPVGKLGQGFVEAPMFSDSISDHKEKEVIKARHVERPEDDLPEEDIPIAKASNDNIEDGLSHHHNDSHFEHMADMSPLISEEELNDLKSQLESLKSQVDEAKAYADEMSGLKLTVEKALMERDKQLDSKTQEFDNLNATLPDQLENARKEGYQAGYDEAKAEFEKHYQAEKDDYMAKIDNFMAEALKKLDEIKASVDSLDDQIPDTVIGFVKTLIGQERIINDDFALNLIKNNISKLQTYKDVSFSVNPEDVEIVQKGMPDYKVDGDNSIEKGCVIVHSQSGEFSLNVDDMIKDLEEQINEKLTAAKDS